MMHPLIESIVVFGAEMQKMLTLVLKFMINIDNFFSQNMNIAEDQVKMHIIYLASMWVEQIVLLRYAFLR